jgi:serpin B
MCYIGAKNETASQLKSLLNFSNFKDDDILRLNSELMDALNNQIGDQVTLNTANKIYPNEGFNIRKEFVDSIVKNFHSEVQQLNYSDAEGSAKIINDWVSLKTKEKINNLVPSNALNASTRLVLVNAIYFKGNWLQKFNKEGTIKEDFTLADGSKQKVDMMRLVNKKWKTQNLPEINAQVCVFPYAGEKVSMTIILPHVGVTLESVESKLNGNLIKEIFSKGFKQEINVFIPKFKLEYSQEVIFDLIF